MDVWFGLEPGSEDRDFPPGSFFVLHPNYPIEPPEKGKSLEGEIFDIHLACLQSHLQETRKIASAKIINRDFATADPVHNPSRIQGLG